MTEPRRRRHFPDLLQASGWRGTPRVGLTSWSAGVRRLAVKLAILCIAYSLPASILLDASGHEAARVGVSWAQSGDAGEPPPPDAGSGTGSTEGGSGEAPAETGSAVPPGEPPADEGSAEPPVDPKKEEKINELLGKAAGLAKKDEWEALDALLNDDADALLSGNPQYHEYKLKAQLLGPKMAPDVVKKHAQQLAGADAKNPWACWGKAIGFLNGKKPDVGKALAELSKGRAAKNAPAGLTTFYYLTLAKAYWYVLLVVVLLAGGVVGKKLKDRKKKLAEPVEVVIDLTSTPTDASAATADAPASTPPAAGPVPAAAAPAKAAPTVPPPPTATPAAAKAATAAPAAHAAGEVVKTATPVPAAATSAPPTAAKTPPPTTSATPPVAPVAPAPAVAPAAAAPPTPTATAPVADPPNPGATPAMPPDGGGPARGKGERVLSLKGKIAGGSEGHGTTDPGHAPVVGESTASVISFPPGSGSLAPEARPAPAGLAHPAVPSLSPAEAERRWLELVEIAKRQPLPTFEGPTLEELLGEAPPRGASRRAEFPALDPKVAAGVSIDLSDSALRDDLLHKLALLTITDGEMRELMQRRRIEHLPHLIGYIRSRPDPVRLAYLARELGHYRDPGVTDVLIGLLYHDDARVILGAIQGLEMNGDPAAILQLCPFVRSDNQVVYEAAKKALATFGPRHILQALLAMPKQADARLKCAAVYVLARMRGEPIITLLLSMLDDAHDEVRHEAINAMAFQQNPAYLEPLRTFYRKTPNEQDKRLARKAIVYLQALAPRPAATAPAGAPAIPLSDKLPPVKPTQPQPRTGTGAPRR